MEVTMTYYHRHHIIPKHAGGTDDPSNIQLLTVEEHAEAHRLLFEEFGRWQDRVAWQGLSGRMSCEEVQREAVRQANTSKVRSPETRAKMSAGKKGMKQSPSHRENNARAQKGKVLTAEHRAKMSEAHKGKKKSPEHQAKITASLQGRIFNEETRLKMSLAAKVRWGRARLNESD